MPRVSIVIASYNHEKYIRECLQSALDQTYQDFEIVITDDGSSDRTVEVIRTFDDPRIRLFVHEVNKGACAAMNNCIQEAKGEYVAVLNSDDAWEPTKLQKQVAYLDDHPETAAVFTRATLVDECGNPISSRDYKYFDVFDKENRPRHAWLNYFFYKGNCLCHPSVLIRKKCYEELGAYDQRMANLPDFDMWVRLCLKYDIHILDEKLVRFRIRAGDANASAGTLRNHIRNLFEYKQILNHYLTINDSRFFKAVFPEAQKYGDVDSEFIPYFLARLALDVQHTSWQLWGLDVLYGFLGNDANARGLGKKYGFRSTDFYELTANHDVFGVAQSFALPFFGSAEGQFRLLKIAARCYRMLANFVRKK